MKETNWSIKKFLLSGTFLIVLYLSLSNLNAVIGGVRHILNVLKPVIYGISIAFVLNILLKLIEEKLLVKLWHKNKYLQKHKRAVSIVLTFVMAVIIIIALVVFVLPQLSSSAASLVERIPQYINNANEYFKTNPLPFNIAEDISNKIYSNWNKIISSVGNFLTSALPQVFGFTLGLTSTIFNVFLGIIFSVYILSSKEKLAIMCKKILYAFVPNKITENILYVSSVANRIFSKFIAGQMTECVILGAMCFLGMMIFHMPYPLLISVIIGSTSIIPMLGAYIGIIPSAFIILMDTPIKAFWFVIFIVVLQQLEGNFVYPKVVGSAIGINGLWVMVAITIGGSLGGVVGMILGVPAMAVLYTVVKTATNKKLKDNGISL